MVGDANVDLEDNEQSRRTLKTQDEKRSRDRPECSTTKGSWKIMEIRGGGGDMEEFEFAPRVRKTVEGRARNLMPRITGIGRVPTRHPIPRTHLRNKGCGKYLLKSTLYQRETPVYYLQLRIKEWCRKIGNYQPVDIYDPS